MDVYHIWCNLKDDVRDIEFTDSARQYFEPLQAEGLLVSYRITRRKLGLGPDHLPEFHIMLDFESLAHLDAAFHHVSTRSDPVESFHQAVNAKVKDLVFALYRDFPDPGRVRGQEKF